MYCWSLLTVLSQFRERIVQRSGPRVSYLSSSTTRLSRGHSAHCLF
ncbi:hypothetical protein X975_24754, partial [Stegodyphus mimosarum]